MREIMGSCSESDDTQPFSRYFSCPLLGVCFRSLPRFAEDAETTPTPSPRFAY